MSQQIQHPQLSDRDLALLSSIIYSDFFVEDLNPNERLQELVSRLLGNPSLIDLSRITGDVGYLVGQGRPEDALALYIQTLQAIQSSPGLQSIIITNPVLTNESQTCFTAAVFTTTDPDTGVEINTLVFRGTDGTYHAWNDNMQGLSMELTLIQEAVERYIEELERQGLQNLTATGHSKGGNLAVTVAIVSNIVTGAVSFSGQGHNNAFHSERRRAA